MADQPTTGGRPPRPTGRHRMPADLLSWLPDWPIVEAWLRRWWISVASAAVILGTAMNVTLFVTGLDPDPGQPPTAGELVAAAPSTTTDAPEPAEPTPSPTSAAPTTPASSPSRTPPPGPIDRLAAFAATVQRLVDSDDLSNRHGRDLLRDISEIAQTVQDGRKEKAVEKLRDLDDQLHQLREDDDLSRAGLKALDVDPIIAALR